MTTYAPTARPPWAVTAWCDDNYIYVELPCTDGPPYIFKESLTEGGLSRCLHLMRDARRKQAPRITGNFDVARHPKIQRNAITQYTEEQRNAAKEVLRKMGITRKA